MELTLKNVKQLLDYAATQDPPVLTYCKSDMVLAHHSDVSYLNKMNGRSQAGDHHFMSDNTPNPLNNGVMYNTAEIIKQVMSLLQILS